MPDEIKQAKKFSSFHLIKVDERGKTLQKLDPRVSLNFGAIAKGYALDKAIDIFRRNGHRHFYINLGGSSIYYAHPSEPLKVEIINPLSKEKIFINIKNQALSTSGNYLQSTLINGKRYSHIINPITGLSTDGIISCSVLIDSNILADIFSTYFFLLGIENSKTIFPKWAKKHPQFRELILISDRQKLFLQNR